MRRNTVIQKNITRRKRVNNKKNNKLDSTERGVTEILSLWGLNPDDLIIKEFENPQLVMKMYHGEDIDIFLNFYKMYIKKLNKYQISRHRRDMDRRTPYYYYRNMIIGWVLEAGLTKWLRSRGIPVVQNDTDGGRKEIFNPNHKARLDLNIGNTIYLEVQHTTQPMKKGQLTLAIKEWKYKKFRNPKNYLITFYLNEKKAVIIHVYDFLLQFKKEPNYYDRNKPAYILNLKYGNIPASQLCVCDVTMIDKFILELLKLHWLRRKNKQKVLNII